MALTDTFHQIDLGSVVTGSTSEETLADGHLIKTSTTGMVTYVRFSFEASLVGSGTAEMSFYLNSTLIGTINIPSSASYSQVMSIDAYADATYEYTITVKVGTLGDRLSISNFMVQTYKV